MKKLTNHIKQVQARYLRRKNRHNVMAKLNPLLPRLIVNKSNQYCYAQVVDKSGNVLANAKGPKNITSSFEIGKQIGEKLLKKKVDTVVFDRNGYMYHGKVKAIADGAREAGLKF